MCDEYNDTCRLQAGVWKDASCNGVYCQPFGTEGYTGHEMKQY